MSAGPFHPRDFMPGAKLPKPKSFEEWKERVVARAFRRITDDDFNHAFDAVVAWMDGKEISLEQAQHSAGDITLAMCGVLFGVIVQRCEATGITLLTITARNADGGIAMQRTRKINLLDEFGELTAEPVKLARVG